MPTEASSSAAPASHDHATTVPDTQLGLSSEEILLLRQGQAALAANSSSSRAASRASSQGLLLLDHSSLAALGRYFDRVMGGIEAQITRLSEQAQVFTAAQFDSAGALVDGADAEIERYRDMLVQIEELEVDFDRIAHIRDIVKGYRSRVEELDRELERAGPPSSRNGGGASSSSHGHHHSSSSHKHSHKHGHKHKK